VAAESEVECDTGDVDGAVVTALPETGGVVIGSDDVGTGGVAKSSDDVGTGGVAIGSDDVGTGGVVIGSDDVGTGGVAIGSDDVVAAGTSEFVNWSGTARGVASIREGGVDGRVYVGWGKGDKGKEVEGTSTVTSVDIDRVGVPEEELLVVAMIAVNTSKQRQFMKE
jgi:hypothetical protein